MSKESSECCTRPLCYLSIGVTVTLGNILLAFLSSLPSIGYGLQLVVLASDHPEKAVKLGALCGMFGLFLLAFFYVLNFHTWRRWWTRTLATASAWAMFAIASVLAGCPFPWATTVCVLLLMTFMLLAIRRNSQDHVAQPDFAKVMGFAFVAWAFIMLALWYLKVAQDDNSLQELRARDEAQSVYDFFGVHVQFYKNGTTHCDEKKNHELSPNNGTQAVTERDVKVHTLCAQANNVIVITWAQPLIAGLVDLATGLFFLVSSCIKQKDDQGSAVRAKPQDLLKVREEHVKAQGATLVVILTLLIGGLYVATYFTEISVNLTIPLLVVLFVGGVVGCAWLYVELDLKGLQELKKMEGSKEYDQDNREQQQRADLQGSAEVRKSSWIDDVKTSTWIQAMAVGSGFIPTFLVLEYLRQRFNRGEQTAEGIRRQEEEGMLSHRGPAEGEDKGPEPENGQSWTDRKKALFEWITTKWQWSDILIKICILGEVFFTLQVLGTKVTYVFLAWLNTQLGDAGLGPVIGIAFLVGFLMFMLPPVPGVPVYIFCGIVVSLQGTDDIGFVGVCVVAILLSLTLKLSACTGQYGIGFYLGHYPRVQHFIGIDTPVTQAIRRILDDPDAGNYWRRVFVLVGGPDWPTSVTCGILRVHVGRMLLGTLPCLFTASPCVLAGVFLADAKAGNQDPWHSALGSAMTFAAGIVQMGSMLLATNTIWQEVYQGGQTAGPPISPALKKLRDEEKVYNERFQDAQRERDWRFYGVLVPAAGLILLTGYSFAGFQSLLFENFSVSGNIKDPTDSFGLGGNPLNIVKAPGWLAISLFLVGVTLHVLYFALVGCRAKKMVSDPPTTGSDTSGHDPGIPLMREQEHN